MPDPFPNPSFPLTDSLWSLELPSKYEGDCAAAAFSKASIVGRIKSGIGLTILLPVFELEAGTVHVPSTRFHSSGADSRAS